MYTNPQKRTDPETQELRRAFGIWLKERREAVGLSQLEAGRLLNYRYYTRLAEIEAGVGRVPADRFDAWACLLEVDTRYFARRAMRHYDPLTFALLFDEADIAEDKAHYGPHAPRPLAELEFTREELKALRDEAGHLVRTLREAAGVVQIDLAEACGYKFYTRISQIERGIGRVPPEDLTTFARILKVDPRWFARELLRCYDPVSYQLAFETHMEAPSPRGNR